MTKPIALHYPKLRRRCFHRNVCDQSIVCCLRTVCRPDKDYSLSYLIAGSNDNAAVRQLPCFVTKLTNYKNSTMK